MPSGFSRQWHQALRSGNPPFADEAQGWLCLYADGAPQRQLRLADPGQDGGLVDGHAARRCRQPRAGCVRRAFSRDATRNRGKSGRKLTETESNRRRVFKTPVTPFGASTPPDAARRKRERPTGACSCTGRRSYTGSILHLSSDSRECGFRFGVRTGYARGSEIRAMQGTPVTRRILS